MMLIVLLAIITLPGLIKEITPVSASLEKESGYLVCKLGLNFGDSHHTDQSKPLVRVSLEANIEEITATSIKEDIGFSSCLSTKKEEGISALIAENMYLRLMMDLVRN